MDYKVTFEFADVVFVSARNEKEALRKARKEIGRIKISSHVETERICAGTWRQGCTNKVGFSDDTECQTCRYEREEDRINTPG